MNKQIIRLVLIVSLIGAILVACGTNLTTVAPAEQAVSDVQTTPTETTTDASTPPTAISVDDALANDQATHDSPDDYRWDSGDVIPIVLNGDSITADSPNVTVEGSVVTIHAAGNYSLNGTLSEGQVAVDSEDPALVRLILNNVAIHNSSGAALNIINAEKVLIVLADQSENHLSDGANYVFPDAQTDEPNATLFSAADLSIDGTGTLTVDANYNDGIASKDGLVIANGTFTINAVDDGIRGKDYLLVQSGNFTINAQSDGLKSDEDEDVTKGYIRIENGVFAIVAGGDAIQGETDVTITDGTFTLTTGGGSDQSIAEDLSAKGIKAGVALVINGGEYTVDSADDALHSNAHLQIDGGNFALATGDDGIHADASLEINAGIVRVTKSYEGIESAVITINGGETYVVASDDGVNAADGSGGGFPQGGGGGGGGGPRGGGGGRENVNYTGNLYLYINGGYLVVDAAGDGIDVNGAVVMTDGVVIVNGPTARMNGALDYDGFFKLSGGLVVAAGSSGMAQAPGSLSTQNSLLLYFDTTQPAGSIVHLQNSAGEEILTFAPNKEYQSLAFSSPKLVTGESYEVYLGGSATGENKDGLYQAGETSNGSQFTTFTISEPVTVVGTGSR